MAYVSKKQKKNSHISNKDDYLSAIGRFRKIIIITLLCSLGVMIAVAVFGGISQVIGIILSSNLYLYALAFIAVFASYLIRFCKWSYYLKKMDIKIHPHKSLAIYLSLYAMNITPGQIGRVIAGYTLDRVTNKGFMKVAPIITMDLFSDFLGFSILAIVCSFFFHKFFLLTLLFVFLLSITFVFLLHPSLYKVLEKIKPLKKIMKRYASQIHTYYSSQNSLNTPRIYLSSLAFTMPADFLNSLGLYFALIAIGIKAKITQSLFIFAASQIFGMISTLPGSIGVADATIVGLVSSTFNVSSSLSSAATIMSRFATLWFGVIIGVIFLIYTIRYWDKPKKKKLKEKK